MTQISTAKRLALWPTLAACLTAAVLPAQEGPLSLELSFSNPGPRSMGFGGAFVALADDATAAFANPAGLIQLARQEVSLEGRLWSYSTPFTEGGRLAGERDPPTSRPSAARPEPGPLSLMRPNASSSPRPRSPG